MSEATTTIQTDMKWDTLLSAVGIKCENNQLETKDAGIQLFTSIKNPEAPTPPYSKKEKAETTAGTNPNEGNSNTPEKDTSKVE